MMNVPAISDIPPGVLLIGHAVTLQIPIYDLNGSPVVISGWTMAWSLRDEVEDTLAKIAKSGGTITVTVGVEGVLNVANVPIVVADTWVSGAAVFPPGMHHHELARTDVGPYQLVAGKALVSYGAYR